MFDLSRKIKVLHSISISKFRGTEDGTASEEQRKAKSHFDYLKKSNNYMLLGGSSVLS